MSFRTLKNILVSYDEDKVDQEELRDLIKQTRDVFDLGEPPETYTGKEKIGIITTAKIMLRSLKEKLEKEIAELEERKRGKK